MMEITEQTAFDAVAQLAATDVEIGRLKAQAEAMDYRRKLVRAEMLLAAAKNVELKSAELRSAWAENSEAYRNACREHVKAIGAWEARRAQRQTWALTVEMWRSLNASRRQGNV